MRSSPLIASALLAALLLPLPPAVQAEEPATEPASSDPLEGFNRGIYRFNDTADRALVKPAARTYRAVLPSFVRRGIGNFVSNLGSTTTLANNLLQGKWQNALDDTTRLVLNTTFGLGGLMDPASAAGIPRHNEDFGQTLGHWGVPTGPYLVLPLLGPSTLRDALGLYPDVLTDGRRLAARHAFEKGDEDRDLFLPLVGGLTLLHQRERLLDLEPTLEGTFDPYAFLRDAYLDRRRFQVADGTMEEDDQWLRDLEREAGLEPEDDPQ